MDTQYSTAAKACTKCKQVKLVTEFHVNRARPDGLCTRCKECLAAISRSLYVANIEKHIAASLARYAANREHRLKVKAIYCAANAEKVAQKKAEWAAANIERRRKVSQQWRHANPDAARAIWQNGRAVRAAAGGKLSSGLTKKLFELQKGMCPCCKQPLGEKYHLDHKMPIALGGSNTDDNMQLLRSICNLQKHAKHPVDFMQERGFLL